MGPDFSGRHVGAAAIGVSWRRPDGARDHGMAPLGPGALPAGARICRFKRQRLGTKEPSFSRLCRPPRPRPEATGESSGRRHRTVRVLSVNCRGPAPTRPNRAHDNSLSRMEPIVGIWPPSHPPLPS
jgi:hypothetical protein